MKILIFGAGPMGSLYAARLFEAGHDITVLDRGERLDELRRHGVVLEDAHSGRREIFSIPVVDELKEDDAYDLVMVIMRKNQALEILPVLGKNRHAHTFLFLMNNAAGPAELIDALGSKRVMVGLPSSGGYRRGHAMRVMPARFAPIPIGEVDGKVRERTRRVAALLNTMRDKRAQIRTDMDAYLVTHVSLLCPHLAIYAAGLDAKRLASTPDAIVLGIRAQADAMRAQRAAGIPIRPPVLQALPWIPEPFTAAVLRPIVKTTFYEAGIVGHASAARDEIQLLVQEFRQRVAPGGVEMPAFDKLAAYLHEELPSMPEGRSEVPMKWRGVFALGAVAVGASAALVAASHLASKHRNR